MSLSRLSSDFWKASRAEDYALAGLPSERGRGLATEKSTTGLCAFQGTTTSKVRCQEPTKFNQAVADGEAKPASSRTLAMVSKAKKIRRAPAAQRQAKSGACKEGVKCARRTVWYLKQLWHGKLRCGSTDTSTENTKKQQQQKQSTTPTTKRSTNSYANKRKLVKQKKQTHRLSENGAAKNDFKTVVASLLAVARRLFIGVSFLFVSVHPRHHTTPHRLNPRNPNAWNLCRSAPVTSFGVVSFLELIPKMQHE